MIKHLDNLKKQLNSIMSMEQIEIQINLIELMTEIEIELTLRKVELPMELQIFQMLKNNVDNIRMKIFFTFALTANANVSALNA